MYKVISIVNAKLNAQISLGKDSDAFLSEMTYTNFLRSRIIGLATLVIFIALFALDVIQWYTGVWTSSPGHRILFIAHCSIIALLITASVIFLLKPANSIDQVKTFHKIFINVGLFLALLNIIPISIGDILINGSIVAYLGALFTIAAVFVMTNTFSLFLFITNMVVMTIALNTVSKQFDISVDTQMINAVNFTLISFILSRILFFYNLKNYQNKTLIEKQRKELEELSIRDGLTDLYNRRWMTEIFEKEFGRAERYQSDLSCILCDLDYFKEINDNFGHAFGDQVLSEFALCLKRESRNTDLIFRYGGEEFLAIFPETDINGTQIAAERIRSAWEKIVHSDDKHSKNVTVSIGLASIKPHHPDNWRQLVAFADKALYRAKSDGRNRIKEYMEESSLPPETSIINKNNNTRYFMEKLSAILEKTKTASIVSLELLTRDMGGSEFLDHNKKSSQFIKLIAERLHLPSNVVETIKRSASLHDSFKVLFKEQFKNAKSHLTSQERDEIENMPYLLSELTDQFNFFSDERSILFHHHERWDGTGYPNGIKGDQIPLSARIFAIADAVSAMSSDRQYRKKLSNEEIIGQLAENAGTQFDPVLVSLIFDIFEEKNRFQYLKNI